MVNIMHKFSISVVGMTTLLVPMSSLAYLTPEQVFGGGGDTFSSTDPNSHPAPPLQREGDEVVEEQQKRAAYLRAQEQESLVSEDAEPVDNFVPMHSPEPKGLFDPNTQYDIRQDRIQNAKGSGPTIVIAGDGTVVDSNGKVLHSGAPKISATGPESILALMAMILAAVSTFAFAQVKARQGTSLMPS